MKLLCGLLFSLAVIRNLRSLGQEQEKKQFPCYSLPRENYTCNDCIQFHPTCAWCTKKGFDDDGKFSRCDTVERLETHLCTPDDYSFPQTRTQISSDEPLTNAGVAADETDAVQLRPQEMVVTLRPKDRVRFPITYRQAVDYPVDLYYLMDLSQSMKDDKDKLTELGDLLSKRMNEITKNFRLGFGSFVDKKLMPFVDPRPDRQREPCGGCVESYGFKNHLSLTLDTKRFAKEVNSSDISGNLDAPEGGMDAIMQALSCTNEIGWREKSRKMIVFSTDAGFHYAGDGRLAGVVLPNDGECHLDNRGYYTMSLEQDYPSIAQMHEKIRKAQANLVFAVTGNQVSLYQRLKDALPDVSSSVGELSDDSSNVVSLIEGEYNKISQKIIMVDNTTADMGLRISYESKCLGNIVNETNTCDGIKVGDEVTFDVTLEAVKCTDKEQPFVISIGPSGLAEALILKVSVLCDCECTSDDAEVEKFSPDCSGVGHLVCGVCDCVGTSVGRRCECDAPGVSTVQLDAKCRRTNDSAPCEGRGVCDCGRCTCNKREKEGERISGQFCECDNFNCPRHNRRICSDHGTCVCQQCECEAGWAGRACECPISQESCRASNGEICNGLGTCECGVCRCRTDAKGIRFSGPTCEICPTCPTTRCLEFRPCVMCQKSGTGPYNATQCADCPFKIIKVDELPEKDENRTMVDCQFVDSEDDCQFYFMYELHDDFDNVTVWVKEKTDCPPAVPILAILLGLIAGIVLIGLILLLAWKLLTLLADQREFAAFENDRLNAKWDTGENPIFSPATSTYTNPHYGGK